jgi:hypothetical protein
VSIIADDQAQKQKSYSNKNFDFCINVPSNWSYGESLTRNGATLTPNDSRGFSVPPRITVGAHANQPSETEHRPQTLDENIQSSIDSLREYGAATDIRILKKEEITLQQLPARVITIQYRDSQSGHEWFVKDVNLIDRENIVYFAELKCSPKDAAVLEPIFDALAHGFHLQCRKKARTE